MSQSILWCVPQSFFDDLNKEFNFTLEAAASVKSAKCPKFFTPDSGISEPWDGETVFCNPPSAKEVKEWARKCFEEGKKPDTTVVLLAPAKTDTAFFHDFIYQKANEVRFIRGRMKYTDEDGNTKGDAMCGSLVAVYRGPREVNGKTVSIKDAILEALKDNELTANELTELLYSTGHLEKYDKNIVAPRLTELKGSGKIVAKGKRICSKAGKKMTVWVIVEEVQQ